MNFGDSRGGDRWARWINQAVRFANSSMWSNFSPPTLLDERKQLAAKGAAS